MSTRASIAVRSQTGIVYGIYVHNNGSALGEILVDNYRSQGEAWSLIKLGHLSVLGERVKPTPGMIHNFDVSEDGVCVAYARDRGRLDMKSEKFATVEEWKEWASGEDAEFIYLFDVATRTWFSAPHRDYDNPFAEKVHLRPIVAAPVTLPVPPKEVMHYLVTVFA